MVSMFIDITKSIDLLTSLHSQISNLLLIQEKIWIFKNRYYYFVTKTQVIELTHKLTHSTFVSINTVLHNSHEINSQPSFKRQVGLP